MRVLMFSVMMLFAAAPAAATVSVRIDAAEPEAVLSILEKRKSGLEPTSSDWNRLFDSPGYVRLKKREAAMRRTFTDDEFKSFVMSDGLLENLERLRSTLESWSSVNISSPAKTALRYLPEGATLRATIFPVIKPRTNSFVFEIKEDPAIFLYLDPAINPRKFENTVAHELHHIGFGTVCPPKDGRSELSPEQAEATDWLGAFGEGLAMLAASGGPKHHPHEFSDPADRACWDADILNFDRDLRSVETFFADILSGRLKDAAINEKGFEFFGEQGPWYTVGWKMAITIEKAFGRKRLIQVFCDRRQLPREYNRAADRLGITGGRWSKEFLAKFN